jgi:hypothetical protein
MLLALNLAVCAFAPPAVARRLCFHQCVALRLFPCPLASIALRLGLLPHLRVTAPTAPNAHCLVHAKHSWLHILNLRRYEESDASDFDEGDSDEEPRKSPLPQPQLTH